MDNVVGTFSAGHILSDQKRKYIIRIVICMYVRIYHIITLPPRRNEERRIMRPKTVATAAAEPGTFIICSVSNLAVN